VKISRSKRVLGLALGDKSILIAEASASNKPRVEKVAEFIFPPDLSMASPADLGKALGKFLSENKFSANQAVIGIPVKSLLVKSKDVPPADTATVANMLRLEAESEFSTELKDLVFEFAESTSVIGKSVLLLATPKKNIDAAAELCEAARLNALAVTPSALALGRAMGAGSEREMLVLTLGQTGSEISVQQGAASSGMKHLRAAEAKPMFVSELRRTMTMLPASVGGRREVVLWNGIDSHGLDAKSLSEQLGLPVRSGELSSLGVDAASATASANGQSQRYAGAVALALAGLSDRAIPSDFLHSRLAPPKPRRFPRWAYLAAVAFIAAVVGCYTAYQDMQQEQADLDTLQAKVASDAPTVTADMAFVSKVSTAWQWHTDAPRYLACMRDLTLAIPEDYQTYVTTLTLHDEAPHVSGAGTTNQKEIQTRRLVGSLDGRTPDQTGAVRIVDQLTRNPAFSEAKLGNTGNVPRAREVTFQITFIYDPDKAK
jgi:hypothetical protein